MTQFIVITCLDNEVDEIKSLIVDRLTETLFDVRDSTVIPDGGSLVYYTASDIAEDTSRVTVLAVNQELGD